MRRFCLAACLLLWCIRPAASAELRVGPFEVDATPPLGSPVAYAPARKIDDPLSARGVVILSNEKPIVLCAVDWIGIGNGGLDAWRDALAQAAGTTRDHVSVHCLHQHDGPRCDFTAEALLAERGLSGEWFSPAFARQTIRKAADAVKQAAANARPVTHLGVGKAKVEKVASNRRLLGPDGKVKLMRWSKSTIPEAINAPEGVIDPYLRLVAFYQDDEPIAVLTYYATHPQSYYGQGDVTCEFVGIARNQRQADTKVPHIHFNGASGNVAAGKYNDGSHERRAVLAQRMADGMTAAWKNIKRVPIDASQLEWRTREVKLPVAAHLSAEKLLATLNDEQADKKKRMAAASDLAWLQRASGDLTITLSCLRLGNTWLVHMPGELFVEYQLSAQDLRPTDNVCLAAYGDYGPGYIGTAIAYTQGGYETSPGASNVSPEVEEVLMQALRELLK